jgi:hypothetical protein
VVDKNKNWEPVENLDYNRRPASEWAKIYGIITNLNDDCRLWSEYELAYHMCNSEYIPSHKDFDKLAAMEMRALELKRDIFISSSVNEREILLHKYIETEWVRKKLNVLL